MGVNIAGRGDIAVPQPLLDVLESDAVGVKQTGAAVPEIVETDVPQTVLLQKSRKGLGEIVWLHELAHLVHIHIVQILLAVTVAADPAIRLLLVPEGQEQLLEGAHQRQRPMGGLGLGPILAHQRDLAVHLHLGDRVRDGDGLSGKVDGAPFEAAGFASPESVERCQDHAQLQVGPLDLLKQHLQLLPVVGMGLIPFFPGSLHPIRRIVVQEPGAKGVLESLTQVGVAVDDRIGTDAAHVQFIGVVVLVSLK